MSAFFAAARERVPKGQDLIVLIVIWTLLVSVPFWLPLLGGYTALASKVLVFGLAAMGLNILLGFTGVLSFGHAAYFGLGAYGAGLTLRYLVHSTPLAMLAGTLFGGLAGTLFGMLIVRRRGVYFAMCTIAFGQLWYYLAYSWNDFTGGFDGLRDFHREPIGFGRFTFDITQGETRFYFFLLAIFAVAVGLMGLLLRSPFGRTLVAIRENERRARFLGIPVERHIWISFSISCFIAALAGTLTLHYTLSGYFVVMTVIGGMRTFWGPLVGAALFVMLQDYISSMTVNWMSFIGVIFILVVLFFPRGLLGMRRAAARNATVS